MESLKGFRTLLSTYVGVLLSTLDTVREVVVSLAGTLDAQLSDGGAAAAVIAAVLTLKALVADVVPKLRGTLNK